MRGLTLGACLLALVSAQANFDYTTQVKKHKKASVLPIIEALVLENCLPAKTLDFLGSHFEVETQHNDKGIAYTVRYDLQFPEKKVASALVVQSLWPDNHGGSGKPFNVLTDKYNLCR